MHNRFRVGESHQVDPPLNSVTGPTGTIRLEPKVMQVLLCLAARPGEVVAKERLMEVVWTGTFVTDDVLTRAISELRRVFDDDAKEQRVIQTIPKVGYRLIASVSFADSVPAAVQASGAPARPVELSGDSDETSPSRRDRRRSWLGISAIALTAVLLLSVFAWRRMSVGTETPRITIAVLPFELLGSDAEREYLADGLTEETIASLGQIDPAHLSVIARTSTRAYKGTTKSIADIGRELGADYLVEGSLRIENRRLRVTSTLNRVSDQVQIWAQSYDQEPESLLELQREMSTAIARQVRLRLSPERLSAFARRHTRNPEAYDLYLRGRHLWNQLTPQTNRRAVEHYVRATELDPEYALAWSGLADAYAASPINSDVPPLEAAPRARDAIARAIASDPDQAEVQAALGMVHYWLDWNWPAAEAAFRKAISVDPSYAQAHRLLGIVLASSGRPEEAKTSMRRARELDPLYPMQSALSANVEFQARNYSEGLQFARHATTLGPSFWITHYMLATIEERLGNDEAALAALAKAEASSPNSKMSSLRGYIVAKQGRRGEAEAVLTTLEAIASERYMPPYAMALVHAGLGQRDPAFQWLERAYAARDVHLTWLPQDGKWDPFRDDPRFRDLLTRCGFSLPQPYPTADRR